MTDKKETPVNQMLDINGNQIVLDINGNKSDFYIPKPTIVPNPSTAVVEQPVVVIASDKTDSIASDETVHEIEVPDPVTVPEPVIAMPELIIPPVDTKVRSRRTKQKITPELITSILTDKYHNGKTVSEIKQKFGIGHDAYKFINSYSSLFVEKFGKKKKIVTGMEMQDYWKDLKIE